MNRNYPEPCRQCGGSCLTRMDFMADLPEEKQALLMERAQREHHEKNDLLFRQGDKVEAVYLIHRGRVKLTAFDRDGREQIAGIFSDGETIWEGVFLGDSRYPYSGVCVTPVDCCRVERQAFERIVSDPQAALRVIGLLSRKLHDANERNLLLSTADPLRRLSGFLLYRSRQSASDTVHLRLDDIAGSISLRPETISRKLRELEEERIVSRVGQSGIRIHSQEALKAKYEERA